MNLILIRGLPGSGKSTLALRLMSSNGLTCAQHFEADQYFMEDGEYNFTPIFIGQNPNWETKYGSR